MNLRSLIYNFLPNFIFTMLWATLNALVFWWTFMLYKNDKMYFYLHEMLGASLCTSRATANVVCLNITLVILTICKAFINSIRDCITNLLPGTLRRLLDHHISLHVLCAYAVCLFSVIHSVAHFINNYRFRVNFSARFSMLNLASTKDDVNCLSLLLTVPGVTGVLMLVILMLMMISSNSIVRRDRYGMFWYTHHLAIPFTLLLLLHSNGSVIKRQVNVTNHEPGCQSLGIDNSSRKFAGPNGSQNRRGICLEPPIFEDEPAQVWKWLLVPVVLFIVDRMIRTWRSSQPVEVTKAQVRENRIVELVMKKDELDIAPGQYVLLKCPTISKFEWHPFTPSKCPRTSSDHGNISVHIKVVGNWTDKLSRQVPKDTEESVSDDNSQFVNKVKLDGPYCSPCKDILNFRVSICIAAGIGITPFAAVLNSLRTDTYTLPSGRLYLVWSCRELSGFRCFLGSFYELHRKLQEANMPDYLVVHFFYTGCLRELERNRWSNSSEVNWLRSRLSNGRPEFSSLLYEFARKHTRERIGVFFCGPSKLSSTLSVLCNRIDVGGNSLIYHHDSF